VFENLRSQTHKRLPNYEEGLGILYLVVDELVDSFFPQLSELDDEIDQLEDTILIDPQPAALQQAIAVKRQLVQLRKIVHPQRDRFAALLSGRYELPGMTPEHERYFRDVYDHLIRVAEQPRRLPRSRLRRDRPLPVDGRQQDVKPDHEAARVGRDRSSLPLTFSTGFFGQNYVTFVTRYLRPTWTFWVFGIGLELAAFLAVLFWFLNRERGNLRLRWPDPTDLPHRR
jgi:magnesium transporter